MSLACRLCFFVVLLAAHSISFAETFGDRAEAKQLADRVMLKVAADKMEEAVRLTQPFYTSATKSEFNVILEGVKEKHPGMLADCGKTVDVELIREDKAGENLFRLTYLQRCEKRPMRWVFYFYRAKDRWTLYWFFWDEDITQIFPQ